MLASHVDTSTGPSSFPPSTLWNIIAGSRENSSYVSEDLRLSTPCQMYFWLEQTTSASICTEQIEPGQARSAEAEAHESKESDKIKCNPSRSTKSGRRGALLPRRSSVAHVRSQRSSSERQRLACWQLSIGDARKTAFQNLTSSVQNYSKVVFSKLRESTLTVCLPTGLLCSDRRHRTRRALLFKKLQRSRPISNINVVSLHSSTCQWGAETLRLRKYSWSHPISPSVFI